MTDTAPLSSSFRDPKKEPFDTFELKGHQTHICGSHSLPRPPVDMSASSGDFDEAAAWGACKWNKVKKAAGARSIRTVNAKDLDTREEQVEEFERTIGELCAWSARWKDGWRKPQELCNDEELIIEGV